MKLGLRQSNMFIGVIKLVALVTITFMILIHVFITSGKQVIMENWPEYRCNPLVIPFAGEFGKNTMENTEKCTSMGFNAFFKILMEPYHLMTSSCFTSLGNINDGLNVGQFMMAPMRIFISTVTKLFYSKLSSFMTIIMYYFTKIRDILRRMSSMFHLNLHSALAIKRSIRQLWNGPIGTSSRGMMGFSETLGNVFHGSTACCIYPHTQFKVYTDDDQYSHREICNLRVGDRVLGKTGRTYVTGMVTAFLNQNKLYRHGDVVCTGDHYIYHDDSFQKAKEVGTIVPEKDAETISKIYCPITRSHTIVSKDGICVLDYDEEENEDMDKRQMAMILKRLLPTQKSDICNLLHSIYYNHTYTYWNTVGISNAGISGNTIISSNKNTSIDHLMLGDYVGINKIQATIHFRCVDDFVYQHSSGIYATGRQMIQIDPDNWNNTHISWIEWLPIGIAFAIQVIPDWKKITLPKKDMLFYNIWIGQGIFTIPQENRKDISMLDMMDSIDQNHLDNIYQR